MIPYRTNPKSILQTSTADACFAAMERKAQWNGGRGGGSSSPPAPPPPPAASVHETPRPPADIIYGAIAIAIYLFGEATKTTRRRVYGLGEHYGTAAGFFKLKGALCLSKSRWARFHGEG